MNKQDRRDTAGMTVAAAEQATSRRAVLKGLAAGSFAASASLLPTAAEAASGPTWVAEADVLIVGSGVCRHRRRTGCDQPRRERDHS